jgi:glycosyltransferase involved in cell wall biosynthesis
MSKNFFDISDVIEFFTYNRAATGIQRVQLEFIRFFAGPGHPDCAFVTEAAGVKGFILVDPALLIELVEMVDEGIETRARLDPLLKTIRASQATARPEAGDIFFVSGAFWISSSTSRAWQNAKTHGALVCFLCYDLIPLIHPEFCDEGLVDSFAYATESVFLMADFIFTISEHVKIDVVAQLHRMGLDKPVIALPLAHELAPIRGTSDVGAKVAAIVTKPYVLFVSTIEVRKNHIYTLTLWQRLLARLPADKVPDLVWVGRQGWLVNDLIARVDRLDHLGGKLHVLSQLSDTELKVLYEKCWCTIYPSFAEGWGLPVAESLMFGKPCISSHASSLPEVGGEFVWYVDPDNVTEGLTLLADLIADPARVTAQEALIKASFEPRRWADVGANLLAGFTQLREADRSRAEAGFELALIPGVLYSAGTKKDKQKKASLGSQQLAALDLLLDEGWFRAEPWGRWLKGQQGTVQLARSSEAPAGPHLICFELQSVEFWQGTRILITCPQAGLECAVPFAARQRHVVVIAMALPPGSCDFIFRVDRTDVSGGPDARGLSIGLLQFGYAAADDTAARAQLRDSFGLPADGAAPIAAQPIGHAPPVKISRRSPYLQAIKTNLMWSQRTALRLLDDSPRATT